MFATVRAQVRNRLRFNGLPDSASRPFGYLVARYEVFYNFRVITWCDTFLYSYRNDPQRDYGPLVSFTGHAPRLSGAPFPFALAAPDIALTSAWNVAPATFGGVDSYGLCGSPGSVCPKSIDRFMFHSTRNRFIELFSLVLLAIVGAVLSGALRRRRPYVVTAFVLIGVALVSEFARVVVLDSEPARSGVQEDFALRIALLILVISTLDVLVERRRRRTAPAVVTEASEAEVPVGVLPAQRTESDSLATPVGASDVLA